MSGLADLIERLEKLEGPSREADALLEIELRRQQAYQVGLNDKQRAKWKPVGDKGEVEEGGCRYHAPEYTASLDAATALVERMLPGWKKQIWDAGIFGADRPTAAIFEPGFARLSRAGEPFRKAEASAHTLPIALCLALLRALQQEEKQ